MKRIIDLTKELLMRPLVGCLFLLFAGGALLFSGLGDAGLSDPWEMRMAHTALGMLESPVVLVLEAEGKNDAGENSFLSTQELKSHFDGRLKVAGPPEMRVRSSTSLGKKNAKNVSLMAKRFRNSHLIHGVIMDPGLWIQQPGDKEGINGLVEEIAAIGKDVWQVPVWLVSRESPERQQEIQKSLKARWEEAKSENEKVIPMPQWVDGNQQGSLGLALEGVADSAGSKAWFLKDKEMEIVPFLETWLMAKSFSVFGVSEWAARAPSALLGLLTLLMVFLLGCWVWGVPVGWLAAIVLATSPGFLLQSRLVTGDTAYTLFLLLSATGLLLSLRWRGRPWGWLLMLVGWLGLFLSAGLFGLLVSICLFLGYGLITLDRRVLGPVLVGGGVLGVVSALVLSPDQWTFFSHFTFMQPLLGGERPEEAAHFDVLIKQVGFGFFPWVALLPFAFARLFPWSSVTDVSAAERESRLWLLLFFALPLLMTMVSLQGFGHVIFPASPAIALAVALLLQQQWKGKRMGGGGAFLLLMMLLILWRELRKQASPFFTGVFVDPPFSEEKNGIAFPAEVEVGLWFVICGALAFLLLAVFHGRWVGFARRTLSSFRRGRLLHWGLASSFILLGLQSVLGLLVRYSEAMNTAAGKQLPEPERFFPVHLLARPEHVLLLLGVAVFVLWALFRETPIREWIQATKIHRMYRKCLAPLNAMKRAPWNPGPSYSWWVMTFGLLALVDAFIRLPFPEGFGVGTTFQDPVTWGLLALMVLPFTPLLRDSKGPLGSLIGGLREDGSASARFLLGALGLYVAMRLSKEVWFVPVELWVFSGLFALLSLAHGLRWAGKSSGRWVLAAVALILCWAGSMLIPFLYKWNQVGPRLYPNGHEWLIVAGFAKTRLTLVGYGLVALFGINGIWGARDRCLAALADVDSRQDWILLGALALVAGGIFLGMGQGAGGVIALVGGAAFLGILFLSRTLQSILQKVIPWMRAGASMLEEGRYTLVALVGVSLVIALGVTQGLFPALAVHISQKHVVKTFNDATGPDGVPGNLYRYGTFGNGGADFNFYTQQVPAVQDQAQLLNLLSGNRDVVLKADREEAEGELTVVRSWDPANDVDGDGIRDWPAWGGLVSKGPDGALQDHSASWTPNQWAGSLYIDGSGRSFPVISNTKNTLEVQGTPRVPSSVSAKSRYTLDAREAPNHSASAMEENRPFFLLDRTAFSKLNFRYRKKAKGAHISVLDDRSSRLLLATGRLREQEVSRNEIEAHTLTEDQFSKEEGVVRVHVDFDDALDIAGYRLAKETFKRKSKLQVEFFYRVKKTLSKDYKVFMHIERPGTTHRIHGDHYVMNRSPDGKHKKCVGCYENKHWMKGDIIVDAYEREIPSSTPSGMQEMWMGFYNPRDKKRLKVKEFNEKKIKHDGKNRVMVGKFRVR